MNVSGWIKVMTGNEENASLFRNLRHVRSGSEEHLRFRAIVGDPLVRDFTAVGQLVHSSDRLARECQRSNQSTRLT